MGIDFSIMVGGEAGQGVQSVGAILSRTMARGGLSVFADQDYESRVRGGHNFFRIRGTDREILAVPEKLDILVALNRETVELHRDEVRPDGVIICDEEHSGTLANEQAILRVPLTRLAEGTVKNKLMTNTVAVGAAMGVSGFDFEVLAAVLRREFIRHGEKTAEDNVVAARAGFDFALRSGAKKVGRRVKAGDGGDKMLLHGNDAIALGALAAGCKFIAGYPMTPATPILEYMADKSKTYGVVAVHVEDEIAAINMSIGAAYAGVRSMVATSGGGFCLMVEGLALAGMTETPVVIVLGQRPGPATGLPTRTEQGELWFALHAGHGEFPRAILAPSTAREAFFATVKAFNLAEKYQVPVIILTDHHLATSYATVERFDLGQVKIDRGDLLLGETSSRLGGYKRHLVTDSGVSPRALPGQGKALVVTDSDEHDEEGHLIEDAETRNQQNMKRLRKQDGLRRDIASPMIHSTDDAGITLVGWGSTYGAIREAAECLRKDRVAVTVLHLSELWPFPAEAVSSALEKGGRSVVIENNATGQLAQLIRRETGRRVDGTVLKSDGRPFSSAEIVGRLKKEVL